MGKILSISLKLNFTPNLFGCYWLTFSIEHQIYPSMINIRHFFCAIFSVSKFFIDLVFPWNPSWSDK